LQESLDIHQPVQRTTDNGILTRNHVSLYIHIPFCQVRCHYCDFATFVGREEQRDHYIDTLLQELELYPTAELAVSTVFLGGGTPSLLTAEQMGRLLAGVTQRVQIVPGAEITAECNPGTVDEAKLTAYRLAGINRLSFGAQTFDAELLPALGRLHTVEQTVEALALARAAGFSNVSLDLMFGLPRQSLASWELTLDTAIGLEPTHVSVYGLTIEPATNFGHWQRSGQLGPLPDEDLAAAMLEAASDRLTNQGYEHYEIANFARPGSQARHNLTYWRNTEYIGLGMGAHSYFRRRRYANAVAFNTYLAGPVDFRHVAEQSQTEEIEETSFLNLRLLQEGLALETFRQRFGLDFREIYGAVLPRLQQQGWLTIEGGYVRLTPAAIPIANEVFERFLVEQASVPALAGAEACPTA